MRPDESILVNLSGRGDKDIGTVADLSGADFFCRPSCQGQSVKGDVQNVPVALINKAQSATNSGVSQ
jgi:tryptophan synthase beta chain